MTTPKSDDLAVRVWFRFIRLESRLQTAVTERLREIGLSVPQCDVLTTLTEAEGVSQQDLAKRLYVTKGNISGLLDRLESAGLVERRAAAVDRRQYEIYLTPPGREAAERAIAIQHELIRATLGRLPAGDLAKFEGLLVAARDLVRTYGGPIEVPADALEAAPGVRRRA
jgi:MarR family transcriptional regulator, organic hydroperoxide resistance regulator